MIELINNNLSLNKHVFKIIKIYKVNFNHLSLFKDDI